MFRYLIAAIALFLLSNLQPAAAFDLDGTWNLAFQPRPKVAVIAFGQSFRNGLPALPTSDTITFTTDPDSLGTGTFESSLFSGDWMQKPRKIVGTASDSLIKTTMEQYLAEGSFLGFKFSGGELRKNQTILQATERKNGTIKGNFIHISKWVIHLTEPRKMDVPVQVRLTANFVGTHLPTE